MADLKFNYGLYENMPGFWVEIESVVSSELISGGHFNTMNEVYRFYIRSKRYFGKRLKGKVRVS